MQPEMTDAEVVAHLRQWVTHSHSHWAWCTDACGYEQHIRFVAYRNQNIDRLENGEISMTDFILEYATKLESDEIPPYSVQKTRTAIKGGKSIERLKCHA